MVCIVMCIAMPAIAQAAHPEQQCADSRKRLSAIVAQSKSQPAAAQFQNYLKFLISVTDDPVDCVTTDTYNALSHAEESLIVWTIAEHTYGPDKVFYCHEMKGAAKRCQGSILDDTPLRDENRLLTGGTPFPRSGAIRLTIAPELNAKVIGIYGQNPNEQPAPIRFRRGVVQARDLQRSSVLFVILRTNDALRFHKCVWYYRQEVTTKPSNIHLKTEANLQQ